MFKKALVLAPHTDDGELGCGGTISKLAEEGYEIHYAAFSTCELSVPPGSPKNILETEVKDAIQTLGIGLQNLHLYRYSVRTFSYNRQSILDDLINLKKSINPDIVFTPSINDIHQDHHTISEETMRAFKNTTILGYEIPWNDFTLNLQAFFKLNENNLLSKINAINCYKSQKFRSYTNPDFIKSMAKVRGLQAGVDYAEAFEVIRLIIK